MRRAPDNDDVCPGCGRAGHVGHACEHRACARDGLHFVPRRFVAADAEARDARVGRVIGPHLLVERLARAGIDVLYRALQLPALLEVELALVPSDRDDAAHADLYRQAIALARLGSHPNVTRLTYFAAEAEGTVLAVESCARGGTLADALPPDGGAPVASADARLVLEPVAAALAALAAVELVHGEIRPEVVLVAPEPGHPVFVRLGGFVRMPTPGAAPEPDVRDLVWRAPEQIFAHAVGPTTDAYALAAIAFTLIVGRTPFPDDDRAALIAMKRDPSWDPGDHLPAPLPPEALSFFQWSLAPDATVRFGPEAFARALTRALAALAAAESSAAHDAAALPEPALEDEPVHRTRPPRHTPARREPILETSDEPVAPRAKAHHAGSTQELDTRELDDLAHARATPRMHHKPDVRGPR